MDSLMVCKALADDTRLCVLLLLLERGELCVCDLMDVLMLSQPKVSRHLAMLRSVGLVSNERRGQWIYYQLDPRLPVWVTALLQAAAQGYRARMQELTINSDNGGQPCCQTAC
ncbi:metalloregulator ArsR/SmtB family transcription factor [Thalassolituus sp.]|jgi:ArsR family transcriptional regulator|uniref:metalloregulator ArsR/SmtB family transcription factor n=1 Tax=Thalassolituus sp. TaxID=2030822 RepID=UPI002A813A0A|nr:metalloregulator ArsR/SmtB family transcription factor [Thalassolituus sp.]